MNKFYLVLILSVAVSAFGNVLLKKGALKQYDSIIREYLNVYVITGYLLIFGATLLTVFALSGMEFKNAPIIESLGYVFILIMGKLMLNEKITKRKLIGNAVILLGIVVYYL